MALKLSRRHEWVVQSEIRNMSIECDLIGGINLSQGVCDLEVPAEVRLGAKEAIDAGINTYTRYDGLAELREAIAHKQKIFTGLEVNPETEIIVSAGATGAFYCACLALLDPGDEVILFEPYYGYHVSIAWRIHREDGGPIFYRGERIGRHGKPFRIFKFRTMVVNADKIGGTSTGEDDPRITRIGKLLRQYKLDEFPQLINVITGEMSLVGPRPQVPWAVKLYSPEEMEVLKFRPGITDFASIIFRNEGEILSGSLNPDAEYLAKIHPEKMRLALYYVNNQSLVLDLKIILKTLASIFRS